MSSMPAVIVKKSGFFSSLFFGLFGFLTVVVFVAGGLGFYALRIADSTASGVFSLTGDILSGVPDWVENMPPFVSETLDDRRAPDYRDQLDVSVKVAPSPDRPSRNLAVVEVSNKGDETVSMLALTITLENQDGVPVDEQRVYAATPLVIDEDEWRGPLMPNETRRFVASRYGHDGSVEATVSVTDLRVWNGPRQHAEDAPATADMIP